jgi:hypothetical protein
MKCIGVELLDADGNRARKFKSFWVSVLVSDTEVAVWMAGMGFVPIMRQGGTE